mgnify:CR=1 FL=1
MLGHEDALARVAAALDLVRESRRTATSCRAACGPHRRRARRRPWRTIATRMGLEDAGRPAGWRAAPRGAAPRLARRARRPGAPRPRDRRRLLGRGSSRSAPSGPRRCTTSPSPGRTHPVANDVCVHNTAFCARTSPRRRAPRRRRAWPCSRSRCRRSSSRSACCAPRRASTCRGSAPGHLAAGELGDARESAHVPIVPTPIYIDDTPAHHGARAAREGAPALARPAGEARPHRRRLPPAHARAPRARTAASRRSPRSRAR